MSINPQMELELINNMEEIGEREEISIVGDMILYNRINAARIQMKNLSATELEDFVRFIKNANKVRELYKQLLELNNEIDILKARLGSEG